MEAYIIIRTTRRKIASHFDPREVTCSRFFEISRSFRFAYASRTHSCPPQFHLRRSSTYLAVAARTLRILLDPTLPFTIVPSILLSLLGACSQARSALPRRASPPGIISATVTSLANSRRGIIISGPVLTVGPSTITVLLWTN